MKQGGGREGLRADAAVSIGEAIPLWSPTADDIGKANITAYAAWLKQARNLDFQDYWALHAWSVANIEAFWESLFAYFQLESATPYDCVLTSRDMPGARWFPGAHINFARHVLRAAPEDPDAPAIFHQSEGGPIGCVTWGRLQEDVARMAAFLRARGVGANDAVVAFVANRPEAIIGFLAAAAIGAVWASCSPDFGADAVQERFAQLNPKALIAVDGYRFGGKQHDRVEAVRALAAALPTLELVIHAPSAAWVSAAPLTDGAILWSDALADGGDAPLSFAQTPFDHPLFVAFSSGTTGPPKAIVHGHGGITLESFKLHALHENQTAQSRTLFFTTTGWIVWFDEVVSGLMCGGAVVIYDGNPIAPDPMCLWRLAAETKATSFGASPVFLATMLKSGLSPKALVDLSHLKAVNMTGSPASPEVMAWAAANTGPNVHVSTISGGTEIYTAIVGACPILPSFGGEFQCPQLGVDVVSLSDSGEVLIGEVGELVIRQPMPTMPLRFLNDPGDVRLRESYFDVFPGRWRHGDFFLVNERGGSFILGRSDATLNRHGVRIGTAEIYRILEQIPGVADSLIVNLELPGSRSFMPLFVQLSEGATLNAALLTEIKDRLRTQASPRHVPDDIQAAPAIPYTVSGKKLEVPVKKILMGLPAERVANRGAMRNPESLAFFAVFAEKYIAP